MDKLKNKINRQEKDIRNLEIKAKYYGGYTMKEIAEEEGLSESMISRIINKAKK